MFSGQPIIIVSFLKNITLVLKGIIDFVEEIEYFPFYCLLDLQSFLKIYKGIKLKLLPLLLEKKNNKHLTN